jgi:7-cyano-7-deazaguanine synthase
MEKALQLATTPTKCILLAPFINTNKTEILLLGKKLGVPYQLTWTCYEGQENPCNKCSACIERNEAFKEVGINE